MPIPFIQQLSDDKRVIRQIERSVKIENQARAFIKRGGRYLIQIQKDAKVHLMAVLPVPKFGVQGMEEVAHLTCDNGPELLAEVDELVWLSIRNSPPPVESQIIQFKKPELIV